MAIEKPISEQGLTSDCSKDSVNPDHTPSKRMIDNGSDVKKYDEYHHERCNPCKS